MWDRTGLRIISRLEIIYYAMKEMEKGIFTPKVILGTSITKLFLRGRKLPTRREVGASTC